MNYLALCFINASVSPMPDPIRLSLEHESARWFFWLVISGCVVALGCILEIWETYVSLIAWWRQRKDLPHNENPKSWRIPMAAFGLLLVIIGVVGETIFEALVSNADAAIREHESAVLSDAEMTAGIANGEAFRAEAGNVKLGIDLEHAKTDTERAATRASQANGAAELERIERLKLEKQIAPRRIDDTQRNALWQICFTSLPYRRVDVVTYTLDTEAAVLASEIMQTLGCRRNDFVVDNRIATVTPMGGFIVGIQVTGSDSALVESLKKALFPLSLAPENVRIPAMQMSFGDGAPAPSATILVGAKPPQ